MKSKVFRGLSLAGLCTLFLLLQGCATGQGPMSCLYWPYGEPLEDPMVPTAEFPAMETAESMLLPPEIFTPVDVVDLPPAEPAGFVYVIKKGETLSQIASVYGISWKRLAEFNGMTDPNKIFPGQEIKIPSGYGSSSSTAPSSSPKPKATKAPTASIAAGTSYVIQRGDTLSGIATRTGVSVAEIKAANALTGNQIVAGKSISIPTQGSVPMNVPVAVESKPVPVADPVPVLAPIIEEAVPAPKPMSAAPVYDHVMYPGETIEDVARQYGSSKEEIMILNGIIDPSSIKPGTKLLVPIPE